MHKLHSTVAHLTSAVFLSTNNVNMVDMIHNSLSGSTACLPTVLPLLAEALLLLDVSGGHTESLLHLSRPSDHTDGQYPALTADACHRFKVATETQIYVCDKQTERSCPHTCA